MVPYKNNQEKKIAYIYIKKFVSFEMVSFPENGHFYKILAKLWQFGRPKYPQN